MLGLRPRLKPRPSLVELLTRSAQQQQQQQQQQQPEQAQLAASHPRPPLAVDPTAATHEAATAAHLPLPPDLDLDSSDIQDPPGLAQAPTPPLLVLPPSRSPASSSSSSTASTASAPPSPSPASPSSLPSRILPAPLSPSAPITVNHSSTPQAALAAAPSQTMAPVSSPNDNVVLTALRMCLHLRPPRMQYLALLTPSTVSSRTRS